MTARIIEPACIELDIAEKAWDTATVVIDAK